MARNNKLGITDSDVKQAEKNGIDYAVLYNCIRRGWKVEDAMVAPVRRKIKDQRIYALYKGEEILADGTIDEIAEKMSLSYKVIGHYKTPTYAHRIARRKNANNCRVLVCLDDDDEDNF